MKKVNKMWNYFVLVDDTAKTARCNFCKKILSFRTTTGNLRSHLKKKHRKLFERIIRNINRSNEKQKKGPEVKLSSEIWRQFQTDDSSEEEACCIHCQASVPNQLEDMKNHLEEHHTATMDNIIEKTQKILDEDSDDDKIIQEEDHLSIDDNAVAEDSSEVYTEIVYLEDAPKRQKLQHQPQITNTRVKAERSISIASDDCRKQKETEPPLRKDLKSFIDYITCLLQTVPPETFQKLQLDIISSIINAQTKPQQQDFVVINSVADNISMAGTSSSSVVSHVDKDCKFVIANSGTPSQVVTLPYHVASLPQIQQVVSNTVPSNSSDSVSTSDDNNTCNK